MRRWIVAVFVLACVTACASQRTMPSAASQAPLYPRDGFGRIGCFAGAGLYQFYNGPSERTDSAARAGPWLVLDSLDKAETRVLLPRATEVGDVLRQGTIIFDADTTATIIGLWSRPATDSIVLVEHRSHPSVSWRFRWRDDALVGEGTLRSDMSIPLPNGRRFSPTHYWNVELMPVSCDFVPRNRSLRIVTTSAGSLL